jgi:hypothetical protein
MIMFDITLMKGQWNILATLSLRIFNFSLAPTERTKLHSDEKSIPILSQPEYQASLGF